MRIKLKKMPLSMMVEGCSGLLNPTALVHLEAATKEYPKDVVVTSAWYGADAALEHRRLNKRYKMPGFSPYNFGLAVKVGVELPGTVAQFVETAEKHGWFAIDRNFPALIAPGELVYLGKDGWELLARLEEPANAETWGQVAEMRMFEMHFQDFALSPSQVQTYLHKQGFYTGPIDGKATTQMREAVMAFQRAWMEGAPPGNHHDINTQRVIAVVTADMEVLA